MPSSSGPSPRFARSRLEPPPASPSSPSPAAPAPAPPSPGRGPFFLQAPASGSTRSTASTTRHHRDALTPTVPTTFPWLPLDAPFGRRAPVIRGAPTTRATYHPLPHASIVSGSFRRDPR